MVVPVNPDAGVAWRLPTHRDAPRIPPLNALQSANPWYDAFANAGVPVTILDANEAGLAKGLATVDATFQSMVKRGRIDAAEKARRMSFIKGSLNYADLGGCDVIIEAVFESMDLKRQIFTQLDAVAKPGALLATNTSTLDVDEIAVGRFPAFATINHPRTRRQLGAIDGLQIAAG